jgi:peroxiredoxin
MLRLSCFALLLLGNLTLAGEFNKVLSVGSAAPVWKDLEGTDGKKHSLMDIKQDVVVVVFTCNSCPVAVAYEERLLAFAKKHTGEKARVALVAINVNTVKEDQLPEMKKRAEKKKFTFPYLYDPSQKIAKEFGANYTPEFFVLNKDRKVVYLGSMDEKSPPAMAGKSYLEEAVNAALTGKDAPKGETLARGCMIRWNREKE